MVPTEVFLVFNGESSFLLSDLVGFFRELGEEIPNDSNKSVINVKSSFSES